LDFLTFSKSIFSKGQMFISKPQTRKSNMASTNIFLWQTRGGLRDWFSNDFQNISVPQKKNSSIVKPPQVIRSLKFGCIRIIGHILVPNTHFFKTLTKTHFQSISNSVFIKMSVFSFFFVGLQVKMQLFPSKNSKTGFF
jgi:hypothetical protein